MKRPRLPLYGQILIWFFLNLALVAAVLYFVLHVQFQLDLRAILSGRTEEQFKAVADVLSAELRAAPRDEWEEIFDRYDEAYGVSFSVYFPAGDRVMGGEDLNLPRDLVETAVREFPPRNLGGNRPPRRGGEGGPRTQGQPVGEPPGEGLDRRPPPRERSGPIGNRPPPRRPGGPEGDRERPPGGGERMARVFYVGKSGDAGRHWAAAMVSLGSREHLHPPDGLLVASTGSIGGNSIFFDWRPWLWTPVAVLVVSALVWLPFVGRVTRRWGG